jgi:hypothetical protein
MAIRKDPGIYHGPHPYRVDDADSPRAAQGAGPAEIGRRGPANLRTSGPARNAPIVTRSARAQGQWILILWLAVIAVEASRWRARR